MDAFAVSLSTGLQIKALTVKNILKPGLYFGIFQAAMPLLGYFLSIRFSSYIERFSHWAAFFLLTIIGGKMLIAYFKKEDASVDSGSDPLSAKVLIPLAVATSIDALAVGVSFALVKTNIYFAVSVIGLTTFLFSTIAVVLSKKLGIIFSKKSELLGGIILIFIGIKIFIEHYI